jgi:hypothetical protein
MKVIDGGLPDNIASCMSDLRALVRRTEAIDNTKAIDVYDILALIDYWDCEEYFLQNSVRISPNTTIKLKYNGE